MMLSGSGWGPETVNLWPVSSTQVTWPLSLLTVALTTWLPFKAVVKSL